MSLCLSGEWDNTLSLVLNVEDALDIVHLLIKLAWLFKRAIGSQGALALWILELHGEVIPDLVDENDSLLIEPFDALAILPQPVLNLAFRVVDVRS